MIVNLEKKRPRRLLGAFLMWPSVKSFKDLSVSKPSPPGHLQLRMPFLIRAFVSHRTFPVPGRRFAIFCPPPDVA